MTPYEHVVQILDSAIGGPQANIGAHGAFWRNLTRDQFIALKVFKLDLLILRSSANSNLIKALKGLAPFDGSVYPQMPFGFPPVADGDIAFIAQWIDDGCPDDQMPTLTRTAGQFAGFQWHSTKAPIASSRTDDVWFVDAQVGWAVNSSGNIIHTTDGGESPWTTQLNVPNAYLRCVAFASPLRGWVGAISPPNQILFDTRDGGKTWALVTNLPEMAPVAVCGMSVVNESVVYVAGSNQPENPVRMMKTTDGGASWVAWDMRQWADNLIDVYFTSPDRGWVVGGKSDRTMPAKPNLKPVVLLTEDGGKTWVDRVRNIRDQFPLGEWGWKIHFVDDRIGFISLQNYDAGAILTTTDGGLTWQRRVINDPQKNANLEGIGFLDARHGWVGGWGDRPKQKRTSSETLDGGVTWRDANEIGRTINRFRFIGNPIQGGYSSGETVYEYSPVSFPFDGASDAAADQIRFLEATEPLEQVEHVKFSFRVPGASRRLSVRIWDQFGALARTLLDIERPSEGLHILFWDGNDSHGRPCSDGQFIWRVTVDDRSESRLVLLRRQTSQGA
jgi:photosystem II stability/assembly factor-like uncharacterized protein